MFADGPAPFGKRLQVNSASLQFIAKAWNQAPKHTFAERVQIKRTQLANQLALKEYQSLLDQEKLLGIVSYREKTSSSKEDQNAATSASQSKPTEFTIKGAKPSGLNFSADSFKRSSSPSQSQQQ